MFFLLKADHGVFVLVLCQAGIVVFAIIFFVPFLLSVDQGPRCWEHPITSTASALQCASLPPQSKITTTQFDMATKKMPARLRNLSTFTYTRAAKDAVTRHTGGAKQRRTVHKAISFYKGKKEYTRHISENMIDLAKWEGQSKPRGYPAWLRFPEDMLKAVLYHKTAPEKPTKPGHKSKKATPKGSKRYQITHDSCASCDSIAETADELCNCTTTPWDTQNTEAWRKQNIELRWLSDDLGIGTYALKPFDKDFVLGEYVGEIIPAEDSVDSRYIFNLNKGNSNTSKPVAHLDSLRVGSWTRFINHSCNANAEFALVRVGEEVRVVCEVKRRIQEGEEVTIDYRKDYWKHMNEKGIWCGCGEEKCKYSKEAVRARMAKARKAAKQKAREVL
mgnify:CR=1 FL=1